MKLGTGRGQSSPLVVYTGPTLCDIYDFPHAREKMAEEMPLRLETLLDGGLFAKLLFLADVRR